MEFLWFGLIQIGLVSFILLNRHSLWHWSYVYHCFTMAVAYRALKHFILESLDISTERLKKNRIHQQKGGNSKMLMWFLVSMVDIHVDVEEFIVNCRQTCDW